MGYRLGRKNHSMVTKFILLGLSDQPERQQLFFVVFSLIYTATLFGNLTIITLSSMDSRLHIPRFFFLSNLSFLNISYTSAMVPKMLSNMLANNKSIPMSCVQHRDI